MPTKKRKICTRCQVEFECHAGTEADQSGRCHRCNPIAIDIKELHERLDRIEKTIRIERELPKGLCHVCHKEYNDDRIIIYTGRAVCIGCAKYIAKEFIETT